MTKTGQLGLGPAVIARNLAGPENPAPSHAPPATGAPARPTAATRAAGVIAAAMIGILLIAWLLPPLLDWNRYRSAIAAFAAAELGRPVSIGGNVTLRLLPAAVLTAEDVSFPDQGDGVSARLTALRLEVAIGPLLRGHLFVRDLTLGEPALTLPWPLPANLGTPVQPYVRHAFVARVERGSVHLGGVAVTGIDAALQSDATTGALGIMGSADLAGAPWRFTTSVGASAADGTAALTLAIDGDGAFAGTGGQFLGSLAAGVLTGRVTGQGPDLSRLAAAPKSPWRLASPVRAAAGQIEAPHLNLTVAGSALEGHLVLHITDPAGLDLGLGGDRLDPAAWAPLLKTMPPPGLPARLTLDAGEMPLLGGALHGVHAVLVLGGPKAILEQAIFLLPGGAALSLHGTAGRDTAGPWIDGPATLDAPDLHATLAWLRAAAPALPDVLPDRVLRSTSLVGTLHLSPATVAVSAMSGVLDGTKISGSFNAGLTARPSIGLDVVVDRLTLDDWLATPHAWPGFDGDVSVQTPAASFDGRTLGTLDAAVRVRSAGLTVSHFALSGAAGKLTLAGTLGADGSLANVHLSATTSDLADLRRQTPGPWPLPTALWQTGLWQGGAEVEMTASGPPGAWAVQTRADAGDLRIETEATINAMARTGSATVTVRHPGAPRLLAALGAADADRWLETGSFALLAHLSADPSHVHVRDFDLTAASLRLSGRLDAAFGASEPRVEGTIDASTLALPWRETLPAAWLQGWQGLLHVKAAQVLGDLRPIAASLDTDIALQGGAVLADKISASLGGGMVTGAIAADNASPPRLAAQLAFAGADLPDAVTGLPIDIGSGTATGTLDLSAAGATANDLLAAGVGTFAFDVRGAQVAGFDLSRLNAPPVPRPQAVRASLKAALTSGTTPGLTGTISGQIDHGRLTFTPATLTTDAGTIGLAGTLALDRSATDLTLAASPQLRLHLSGPWAAAQVEPVIVHAADKPGRPAARRSAFPHQTRHR